MSLFEDYVNLELPTRVASSQPGTEVTEGLIPVATGYGLVVKWLEASEILGNAKSAYDLAVDEGFTGTLEEWLASLQGEDGADGKSAYDLAVEFGFIGTEEEFVESLRGVNGLSAYEVAIEGGFQGNEAEWLESLKGEDGKSAFELAAEAGYSGTETELADALSSIGTGSDGKSGAVFVTDVVPQDASQNIGDKVMSEDGFSLLEFSSTTNLVKVKFLGITGHTNFRPNITVNGELANVVQNADAPLWNGELDIEVEPNEDDQIVIDLVHEDGATARTVGQLDKAPIITSAVFTSEYPSGQSELKEDDVMDIRVEVDGPVVRYEIQDFGAFKASTAAVANVNAFNVKDLKIANRGNTATEHGFKVRVQKASGAWSQWFESNVEMVEELVSVVTLNNRKPIVTISEVQYPTEQFAIKAGESIKLLHTIEHYDTVAYSSPNGQLDIANPTQYHAEKQVDYLSGNYNDSTDNLTVTARKSSNGATTVVRQLVRIATTAPSIVLTIPAARLRSGGNHGTQIQRHTITLTSNQMLVTEPQLNAPEGTWDSADWKPNATRKVWTRALLVHDNDAKGEFTFNSAKVVNGAGVENSVITGSDRYILGGFVFRTLSVTAYPNRETDIGTEVSNTSKLRCTNLSKGGSGSLNFTYKADDSNETDRYTIKNNTTWYNCDGANSTSNTSGLMQIELEETV